MKKFEQAWRIKRFLAECGETISSLSRELNRPFGPLANNIYGANVSKRNLDPRQVLLELGGNDCPQCVPKEQINEVNTKK